MASRGRAVVCVCGGGTTEGEKTASWLWRSRFIVTAYICSLPAFPPPKKEAPQLQVSTHPSSQDRPLGPSRRKHLAILAPV